MVTEYDYDLLVIGSGPAGQRAAIQAAKLNKKVAVVERKTILGGVCINTGTIPSKTLREAVMHLSGYRERSLYGASYSVKQNITMADLMYRTDHVIQHELDIVRHQLQRNHVELISAEASFEDAHTIRLKFVDGRGWRDITAANVVIATGTSATQTDRIPLDGKSLVCLFRSPPSVPPFTLTLTFRSSLPHAHHHPRKTRPICRRRSS
jgi:NAD(P) transhydrogenase